MTRIVTQSDYEGTPPTVVDYSKSLDLTSYEGSTVTVGETTWSKKGIADMARGYETYPDQSPVLVMTRYQPHDGVIHPGGSFWSAQDDDYRALRRWITEGAQNN